MRIVIKTKVNGNYKDVMDGFDITLFEALKPKFGRMEIVQFTGSSKGDVVHIRFLSPLKADWISDITEDGTDDNRAYFTDVGRVLPPGLKKWKHLHEVKRISESESFIIDDINYRGLNPLLTVLLYPFLWWTFYSRKAKYHRYFNNR